MIHTQKNLSELIYDWNLQGVSHIDRPAKLEFLDETLRDGLQAASVRDPNLSEKVELILFMEKLGIHSVNLGMAFASEKFKQDVESLSTAIRDKNLKIRPNCPVRMIPTDVEIYLDIIGRTEVPLEICAFIGSSPIRVLVEGWKIEKLIQQIDQTISKAVDNSLPVLFVTEDTVRATPETLEKLISAAITSGANRIALCDTVGHATPDGTRNIIQFAKRLITDLGEKNIGIDWHGHRDRGFALANAIAAIDAGASRVHATALGIGERSGNLSMELLLVNCRLLDWIDNKLYALDEYSQTASRITGVPIPPQTPVIGKDAFRTQSGIHASALIKAKKIGNTWLEDRVYSAIPAEWVGRSQQIEIGPNSGRSNVIWWLVNHAVSYNRELVEMILNDAKMRDSILTDGEILKIISNYGPLPEYPE
ncbi:MAG: 2-isopropylmalate synthase [Candidatus Heimdallarchaeota archaeon]|nr:2-isopropylmalate synthase [Candidatus Heimdallarchaeota archaeon]